jgi:hypothetical protein
MPVTLLPMPSASRRSPCSDATDLKRMGRYRP